MRVALGNTISFSRNLAILYMALNSVTKPNALVRPLTVIASHNDWPLT